MVIVKAADVEVGVAVVGVVEEAGSELDLVPSIPSEVIICACNVKNLERIDQDREKLEQISQSKFILFFPVSEL